MSHIQSPLHPELPAAGWNTEILSTEEPESTTYAVVFVKLGNQYQRPGSTSRSVRYQLSGRGGAGNAHAASDFSQRANTSGGPDDFSSTKGRELRSLSHPDKIISTGRGGIGNVRSPSGDAIGARPSNLSSRTEAGQAKYERSLIRKHEAARAARSHSVGRGGAGNIVSSSPSRS